VQKPDRPAIAQSRQLKEMKQQMPPSLLLLIQTVKRKAGLFSLQAANRHSFRDLHSEQAEVNMSRV
jgi:hypothetical protein